MKKLNLIIDVAKCENCNNCVLASKDELVGNTFPGYSAPHPAQGTGVVRIDRTTRGVTPMVDASYVPKMCNHCDAAPCMKADASHGGKAIRKRDDGVVIFDPVAAKGRRDLVAACPYGCVVWNEKEQLPQTWFFDAHLLDTGWKAPRIVNVCPTEAIEVAHLNDRDMQKKVVDESLRVLLPEMATQPRVYYRGLNRVDHVFIGGSAEVRVGALIDCVEGAEVVLCQGGKTLQSATTDAFGDFKLEDIRPASGEYQVRISHPQFGVAVHTLSVGAESVCLGGIPLNQSEI